MKTPHRQRRKKVWKLEDTVHYVIYRELDKLGIRMPYQIATLLTNELRHLITYRSPLTTKKL